MKRLLLAMCFLALTLGAHASTSPTLFYSDLTSGPTGSIVTVYGANLQGTVTVNGVTASVISSSATKVSFVVPSTSTGSIVVGGSNALPFTVRAGHIYYVATNGSDSNSGAQSSPWATIPHAFNTAACGDVIYAMNGVSQTGLDNYGASLAVERKCSLANPLALVGYPGATVTIGSATGQEYGIRNPDINGDGFDGMVFANLVVRASNTAVKDVSNSDWRIVGSDFSCPNGGGEAACVQLDYASGMKFFGNSIHDTGAGGTKYYHSFYATTNSLHVEVGWNHIYNNKSCRGIQFYSTGGSPQYDLIVHDNVISGQQCDGINFSTIDATKGPVEAYNNLVYHVGIGGPNLNTPNEACFASLGYGAPGGQILVYGNTFADCGSAGGSTAGAITVQSGSATVVLQSNLIMQNPGEPVYSPNTTQSLVAASRNVLLTNGTAGVVNTNYQPIAGSPAIGAGTAYSGMTRDLAGTLRPQSGNEDAGAYLYSTTATAPTGPTATLSTSSISFGSLTVNTKSAMQNVTLSNSGTSALAISSIALSGTNPAQFTASNNCGTSLAASQSCTIQAQFAPTTTGAMSAAIALKSNASNPTESVALAGTGAAVGTPAVTVSPATLSFGSVTANTTSTAQTVTVKNTGTATLNIGGVSLTGTNASAFKLTNGCATTLAAGASCSVQVQYAPTTTGAMSATLSVADNASGSPQGVTLSGTGAVASSGGTTGTTSTHYSNNNLYYYNRAVGSTSAAQVITVSNTGKVNFTVSSLAMTGTQASSFKAASNCVGVAPGKSCSISITFTPGAAGASNATLTVNGNAPAKAVPLTGHGY